ncbi:MAG: hypothetical protein U0271_20610 [Polyangiaceae bacterium]
MSSARSRAAALAAILVASTLSASRARADLPTQPPGGGGDSAPPPTQPGDEDPFAKFKYDPNAPKPDDPGAPPAGPTPSTQPRGEVIDERAAPPAKPEDEKSKFCSGCVVLGAGTAILIGSIPLAAMFENSRRTKRRLAEWADIWGGDGADLGFIVGYGYAKADQDIRNYAIATGVVAGVGGAIFIAGLIVIFSTGDGFGSSWVKAAAPPKVKVGEVWLEPSAGPAPAGAGLTLEF